MSTLKINKNIPEALSREPKEFEVFVPHFTPPKNIIWEDPRSKSLIEIDTDKIVITSYSKEYPDKPTPESGHTILETFQKDNRFIQIDFWVLLSMLHVEINIRYERQVSTGWAETHRNFVKTYTSGSFTDSLVTNKPYGCEWSGILNFGVLGTVFEHKKEQGYFWVGFDADCRRHHPEPLYRKIASIKSMDDIAMLRV